MDSDLGSEFIDSLEVLVELFEDFIDTWGQVMGELHIIMSDEQYEETSDLLDRLVAAGEELLGDGGELDEPEQNI